MYLCLLLERTWSCLPLRIACFPTRGHMKYPYSGARIKYFAGEILKLLYPNETGIDQMKAGLVNSSEQYFKGFDLLNV
uniref:Uncharacterized protein n=1 Tax=Salix viminalis TaxID=40686 RepID=A0A6N2LC69_SALVM